MFAWRIPRWILPAALSGVLAIMAADAVLMRRHRVSARPEPVRERIGLHADAEGGGVRVEWDRGSRPIRNADRAILYIEDGTERSQVALTGRQLDGSSVMYLPESERVTFRLEIHRGSQSSSDSIDFGLPQDHARRRRQGPARAVVETMRPSPFERVEPEIEVTQTRPKPVLVASEPAPTPQPVATAEPPKEGRFDRMISRIPLLRRLQKHPQSDGTEPSR
jgi:hypothetical protein